MEMIESYIKSEAAQVNHLAAIKDRLTQEKGAIAFGAYEVVLSLLMYKQLFSGDDEISQSTINMLTKKLVQNFIRNYSVPNVIVKIAAIDKDNRKTVEDIIIGAQEGASIIDLSTLDFLATFRV